MPRKSNTEKPVELNQKNFLKLMAKREEIAKAIDKHQRKIEKINGQLSAFADWLKDLSKPL